MVTIPPRMALAMLTKEPALTEIGTAPAVTGFHHFSPTVSDVEASARWYERVLGMNRVPVTFPHYGAEAEGYAVLLMDPRSGIAIGLHHHDANPGQPSRRAGPVWTTSRSASPSGPIWTHGQAG